MVSKPWLFFFSRMLSIVYYPKSPPRIFGISDELLFLRLLVSSCNWKYLYTCYWANIHSPKRNREYVYTDFHQNIIDVWKTTWYFIFEKNISRQTCWKAGTQSQKGLKSESLTMSAGCHCFHSIYRKDMRTEEIPITFILYGYVILNRCRRDTGEILASVLFMCQNM